MTATGVLSLSAKTATVTVVSADRRSCRLACTIYYDGPEACFDGTVLESTGPQSK